MTGKDTTHFVAAMSVVEQYERKQVGKCKHKFSFFPVRESRITAKVNACDSKVNFYYQPISRGVF